MQRQGLIRRLGMLAGLTLSGIAAQGQISISGQIVQPTYVAPFSVVRVCPSTALGTPCSPTASIYTDPALSVPAGNPYSSDQYGNYSLFAAAGSYIIQVTPLSGITYNYLVTTTGGGGSGVTLQTNTSNNSSQTLLNFLNSTGASGLTWSNPSGGEEQASLANVQGTDSKVLSSGTFAASQNLVCSDSNGGATTSCNNVGPYDVVIYSPAILSTGSQEIFREQVAHQLVFAGNFSGSQGSEKIASTGNPVFVVNKNGSQVGTITYTASSTTTPTFATSGGTSVTFAVGDILTIVGPSAADATLSGYSVTLVATRTN